VLADLFIELGPNNVATLEECRNCLSQVPKAAINSTSVSRLMCAIIRHYNTTRQLKVPADQQIGLQSLRNPSSLWVDSNKSGRNDSANGGTVGAASVPWKMDFIMQALMENTPAPLSAKEVMMKCDTIGETFLLSLGYSSSNQTQINLHEHFYIVLLL